MPEVEMSPEEGCGLVQDSRMWSLKAHSDTGDWGLIKRCVGLAFFPFSHKFHFFALKDDILVFCWTIFSSMNQDI